MTCLECGKGVTTSSISFGEQRDLWCQRCHAKLSLVSNQCQLVQHQPGIVPAAAVGMYKFYATMILVNHSLLPSAPGHFQEAYNEGPNSTAWQATSTVWYLHALQEKLQMAQVSLCPSPFLFFNFTYVHVCRFPCCGKAYPCDVCHDTSEDHPMERAKRMLCGYCAIEQVSGSPLGHFLSFPPPPHTHTLPLSHTQQISHVQSVVWT